MSNSKQTVSGSMSLQGDSPAKISVVPEKAKASKQNAQGCGQRCFDSSEMYGQRGQLLKMYQPLDLKGLHWSYKISARSGICVSGIVYPLVPLARLTRETGFGLWHTPLASATSPAYEKRYPGGKTRKHPIPNLAAEIQEGIPYSVKSAMRKDPTIRWPTPSANFSEVVCKDRKVVKNQVVRKDGVKFGANLLQIVHHRAKYPTPCARDWKDNGSSPAELKRNSKTLATHAGGQLNPPWVEWLMGYPTGWTDLNS